MDDLLLLLHLRLARAHVSARTVAALREKLGSIEAVLLASSDELRSLGFTTRATDAVARVRDDAELAARARAELERLRALDADLLALELPGYPALLAAIHDPPVTLSVLGALPRDDEPHVAIVGARRATPQGMEVARTLGADLAAAGVTVVSGLARGIDRAAHEGALAAGGRTIAVLGSGIANPYPAQHTGLAERIAVRGAVVSELEPDASPSRHSFPQRNRIIAGLSLGVVVVEAGPRSGSLITTDLALQSGRELFAVPGSPSSPLARGPNRLLREGAHLVETASDVLEVLFGVQPRDDDVEVLLGEHTEDEPRPRPPPPAPSATAFLARGSPASTTASAPARASASPPRGRPPEARASPAGVGPEAHASPAGVGPESDPVRSRVLGALRAREPRVLERIAEETALRIDEVMLALGRLELSGRVRSSPAGYLLGARA